MPSFDVTVTGLLCQVTNGRVVIDDESEIWVIGLPPDSAALVGQRITVEGVCHHYNHLIVRKVTPLPPVIPPKAGTHDP